MEKLNTKNLVAYWRDSADRNYKTAKYLYEGKKYSDALFFGHLMIEKILKGLIVKQTKKHAPFVHELDVLAKKTNLDLTPEQMQDLKIITTFNIATRYDSIKDAFYKRCTKQYADQYFEVCKKIYLWLKKQ